MASPGTSSQRLVEPWLSGQSPSSGRARAAPTDLDVSVHEGRLLRRETGVRVRQRRPAGPDGPRPAPVEQYAAEDHEDQDDAPRDCEAGGKARVERFPPVTLEPVDRRANLGVGEVRVARPHLVVVVPVRQRRHPRDHRRGRRAGPATHLNVEHRVLQLQLGQRRRQVREGVAVHNQVVEVCEIAEDVRQLGEAVVFSTKILDGIQASDFGRQRLESVLSEPDLRQGREQPELRGQHRDRIVVLRACVSRASRRPSNAPDAYHVELLKRGQIADPGRQFLYKEVVAHP